MIENGADLLYAERFCVSNVAKEKGILAISNVIDTQGDYPETVAASTIWHFEPTFDKAIAEVQIGGRLRRLLLYEPGRHISCTLGHVCRQGSRCGHGPCEQTYRGDQIGRVHGHDQR